jgi:hypothetical protein
MIVANMNRKINKILHICSEIRSLCSYKLSPGHKFTFASLVQSESHLGVCPKCHHLRRDMFFRYDFERFEIILSKLLFVYAGKFVNLCVL